MDTITLNQPNTLQQDAAPWTMEELVNDTLALKLLLQKETAALQSMNIALVRELHDEKLRLTRKLELQKDLLSRDTSLLQGVTEFQKSRLKAVSQGMDTVMKQNFYEVLKAREVNSVVVRAISREAKKYEQRATGYNQRGMHSSRYNNFDSGPSVALNQMI